MNTRSWLKIGRIVLAAAFAFSVAVPAQSQLIPYTTAPGAVASSSYTLTVNGQPVVVEKNGDVSYARFSFIGTADIQVSLISGTIGTSTISPNSYGYNATKTVSGANLSFMVSEPRKLIVRINSLESLFIFADGPELDAPASSGSGIANVSAYLTSPDLYSGGPTLNYAFNAAISTLGSGGGIVYVPNGLYVLSQLALPANIHLYLESGALLRAIDVASQGEFTTYYPAQNNDDSSFIYITGSNVRISGRGVIDGNGFNIRVFEDIDLYNVKLIRAKGTPASPLNNLNIKDVYLRNSARWTVHLHCTDDIVVKNVKIINDLTVVPGAQGRTNRPFVSNTDGFDIDACENVLIDGCFIYTVDDAFTPKVTGYFSATLKESRNHTLVNNVIWTQKCALKVGDELRNNMSNIFLGNNDMVVADRFLAVWAADGLNASYTNSDITAINNRAETIGYPNEQRRIFSFQIRVNSSTPDPANIFDVEVNGLYCLAAAASASRMEGYDATHIVSDFSIRNMYIAGVPVDSFADIPFSYDNDFYSNISVTTPGGTNKEVRTGTPNVSTANVTVPQDLPLVEVYAADDWAKEGVDTGSFVFSRSGSLAGALTVHFTVSGTATSGSDYTAIGTSVTFAAGEQQKSVTVAPAADAATDGGETVAVTITPNANYVFDAFADPSPRAPTTATVTIADASVLPLTGQVSFTGGYTENFNGLPLTGTPPPWVNNVTVPGWYAVVRGSGGSYAAPATFTVRNFVPGATVGTTAGVSDNGLEGSTGAVRADRSLGIIATSATSSASQPAAIALRLRNDTGATIDSLAITYTGKQWAEGYSPTPSFSKLNFAYSTTATSLADSATFAPIAAVDFVEPIATQTTTSTASVSLNGHLPANQTSLNAVSFPITGGWAPGTDIWLRWSQIFTTGRMSALALDDLVVSSGVPGAPILTQQPASQELQAPADIQLISSAVGTPPLFYQWYRNGTLLAGANSPVLAISKASMEADLIPVANYLVRVTNNVAFTDSATTTVIVHKLPGYPQLTTQITTPSVASGGTTTLSLTHGGIGPFTYQWYKNGVAIPGATVPALSLSNVQFTGSGYYKVAVSNSLDTTTSYAVPLYVDGYLRPVIHTQPKNASLGLNGSVSMRVIATAHPTPAYQWRKNGVPIPGSNSNHHTFWNAQPADAGNYDVVLTNPAGSVTSAPATLTVGALPPATVRVVDQRLAEPYPYRTIASAVALSQPGDIIELAPGSGPYRETAVIPQSGTPERPIVFEGNHELITGFIPFEFTLQGNGQRTFTLPISTDPNFPQPLQGTTSNDSTIFRYLIAHGTTRIRADAINGTQANVKLTSKLVSLSADGLTLILAPGAPTTGWQIGGYLQLGVSTGGPSSWQTFRNIRVSGTAGDCFNLHGTGVGQVFENIVAFNGFDEGYSAHDGTRSEVYNAVFYSNENGIGNDGKIPCQFTGDNIVSFSNLGSGFIQRGGIGETLTNINSWDNGIQNLNLGGPLVLYNVVTAKHRWAKKPWISFQETGDLDIGNTSVVYADPVLEFFEPAASAAGTYNPLSIVGQFPVIREVSELPPLLVDYDNWTHLRFAPAENANVALSGPLADPDYDGLNNLLEHALDLDPKAPGTASLTPTIVADHLVLTYRVRAINTDIIAFAEVSSDLSLWTSGPLAIEETVGPGFEDDFGFETVEARDLTPVAAVPARFVRLRVDKP